jgi:hypothetical protein
MEISSRLFSAGLLCVFAALPLALCYVSVAAILSQPSRLDLMAVAVFCGSAAVSYFLLLLAFRAATARGRKSDGGLLPPLVMKFFLALFGLIGVGILGMGLWSHEMLPVLGGAFYLFISVRAWSDHTAIRKRFADEGRLRS